MAENKIEEVNSCNKPSSNINGNNRRGIAESIDTLLNWGNGQNHSLDVELVRLSTFSTFPLSCPISAIRLAKHGFHYIGDGSTDLVACHLCKLGLSKWKAGADPYSQHKKFSPSCLFDKKPAQVNDNSPKPNIPKKTRVDDIPLANPAMVPNTISNNNPPSSAPNTTTLGAENNIAPLPQPVLTNSFSNAPVKPPTPSNVLTTPKEPLSPQNEGLEATNNEISPSLNNNRTPVSTITCVCGKNHEYEIIPEELLTEEEKKERKRYQEYRLFIEGKDNDYIGINTEAPRYPAYGQINTRIKSFDDSGECCSKIAPIIDFATVGFFFCGMTDYVRCFFCGLGLRNFEAGDVPWIEHVRWNPKCSYLRRNVHVFDIKRILYRQQKMNEMDIKQRVTGIPSTDEDTCFEECPSIAALLSQIDRKMLKEKNYTLDQIYNAVTRLVSQKKTKIDNQDVINMILDIQNPTSGTSSETKTRKDEEDVYEEYKRLKASRTCVICHNEKAISAMLPCGHLCTCSPCGEICRKCPICNKPIDGVVKTYLT